MGGKVSSFADMCVVRRIHAPIATKIRGATHGRMALKGCWNMFLRHNDVDSPVSNLQVQPRALWHCGTQRQYDKSIVALLPSRARGLSI